jgi:hypothetical protein
MGGYRLSQSTAVASASPTHAGYSPKCHQKRSGEFGQFEMGPSINCQAGIFPTAYISGQPSGGAPESVRIMSHALPGGRRLRLHWPLLGRVA